MDTTKHERDDLESKHDFLNISPSDADVKSYQKLALSILLLAVMEQRLEYVRFRKGKKGSNYERQQIQRDAVDYIRSNEWTRLARLADVSPYLIRNMSPDEAKRLMSGNVYHRARRNEN